MKINKTDTIVSLTGSNSLESRAIEHCRKSGFIVYLDIDNSVILDRCNKMKVTRIVGMANKSLIDILEWRRNIYENTYDIRFILDPCKDGGFDLQYNAKKLIEMLNKDQDYVSTRGAKNFLFNKVLTDGLAPDGGLFVSSYMPKFSIYQLQRFINLSFQEV